MPIYHPRFAGDSIGVTQSGRRYSASGAAHCGCELGQWIRDHVPQEVQTRVPRVVDILDRDSHWLLANPRDDASYPPGPVTKANLDEFWRKVKSGTMLKSASEGAPRKPTVWSIQTDLRRRLVQELGLNKRVANVLTLDELHQIKAAKGNTA